MEHKLSRRGYMRTNRFKITGQAQLKSGDWVDIEVLNMAAGGLLFSIIGEYDIEDEVSFDLVIDSNVINRADSFQSVKLDMKFKAVIKYHMGINDDENTYGAAVVEMSQSKKIQLDEMILAIERLGGIV